MITNRSFYSQMSDRQFADPYYWNADIGRLIEIAEDDIEEADQATWSGNCGATFKQVFDELIHRILGSANPIIHFPGLRWKYEAYFECDIFVVRNADGQFPHSMGAGTTLQRAIDMAFTWLRKDLEDRIYLCQVLGESDNVKLFQQVLFQLEEKLK